MRPPVFAKFIEKGEAALVSAVSALARFGEAIAGQLDSLRDPTPRPLLRGLGAVTVEERYIVPELIGRQVFHIWARVIRCLGRAGDGARAVGVYLFVFGLVGLITVALPPAVLAGVLLRPLLRRRIAAYAARLAEPSGA